MASDSEGFESAAEETTVSGRQKKDKRTRKERNAWNDSDSDDEALNKMCEGDVAEGEKLEGTTSTSCTADRSDATYENLQTGGDGSKATTAKTLVSDATTQKTKRPERIVPKQPKARGVKLGAVRLDSKSTGNTDASDKDKLHESVAAEYSKSTQEEIGVDRKQKSEENNSKSTSNSEKKLGPVLEKLASLNVSSGNSQDSSHTSGWSSWGSWGVNSLLSTASNLTTHVSHGISTVTSALETGLGAPDPEELARLSAEQEKTMQEKSDQIEGQNAPQSGTSSMTFDSVLRLVESTAGGLVSGGLTTLETLGKKTMDVLQDGDPGLKKKRAYFFPDADRPVLSQLLREAKEKAEAESRGAGAARAEKKLHFETLFDDYQGLVHLEALEMLSRQCQLRLQSRLLALSGAQLTELQRTLAQVKELCEFPDEEEETSEECTPDLVRENLQAVADGLDIPLPYEKVVSLYMEEEQWLSEVSKNITDVRDIHAHAITALAKLAAATAEVFHKTAELLLVKEVRDTTEEAKHLVAMTTLLCSCTSALATKFSDAFTTVDAATANINDSHRSITNIFLEASNSSSYIQDAGNLLVPVLQMGICK